MQDTVTILPLSEENLEEASKLVNKLFPDDAIIPDDNPELAFKASLHPAQYQHLYVRDKLVFLRYFVLLENNTGKIIGTTGLYKHTNEPKDVVWLGWYGIDPEFRGQGLGTYLLQWTINQARQEGNRLLRLYTSEEHDTAQILYQRFGFREVGRQTKNEFMAIFKELKL